MQTTLAKYLALTLVTLGITWAVYSTGAKHGAQEVQARWDAETIQEQRDREAESLARTAAERELQDAADKRILEKEIEITRLNANIDRLLDQLRKRPQRPSDAGVPQVTGTESNGPGCSGRELYREDGEFLAREAARADKLRLGFLECRSAYNNARQANEATVTSTDNTVTK